MADKLPPAYWYHYHQKSNSSPNLASKAEKRVPRQSANGSSGQHPPVPFPSVADGYSQNPRSVIYKHGDAIGVESNSATHPNRRVPGLKRPHMNDERPRSSFLNSSHMSQQNQQSQQNTFAPRNSGGEPSSLTRYASPSHPPPPAKVDTSQGRQRGESVTSGSSAYTGYNDGPSSPSSQDHNPPLPTAAPKKQKTGILSDLKEAPIINRLFVQNHASTGENDSPTTEQMTPTAPSSKLRKTNIPPPIDTRNDTSIRDSPRGIQAPLPASSSGNYSPVAAYMTTPHGSAFPETSTPTKPLTASGEGFGISAGGAAFPRFPEYRQGHQARFSDETPNKQTRGIMNYSSRPSLDGAPLSAMSPGRRQTRPRAAATHACMTLHRTDRLKLIKFPPSAIHAVKAAIERSWIKGIQSEKEADGQVEIQFKGNPWTGQGDDTCPAIYTISQVMAELYHLGWNLVMATDISKRAMDKDTLIYRQGEIPSPCSFMAVSFNDGDKLRLIKAPNDVINAVKNTWGGNVQRESWKLAGLAWEFKLTGNPWWSSGHESLSVRILLLNMLDAMALLGWELHTSVDITAGPGGLGKNAGSDTDCWILRKVNA